ncbi:isoprenylcysteine carboxylmethyltransferase family protein [Aureimonas altamirensis]|uniref:methyltransferase family protein n=1 Tax=Aureimonas TaxID=414371 RepID=UPI00178255C6|nr:MULTISPECIES: isoprenylcysteine carboxylmethyltransferase family protein [Aureimonas]MCM2504229.1 isoprenylcysteine carboxylmethyltransferase family protein [Aureimonas altamirensis]QOG05147.1 isoprenylcysteine carboxylmethyltransferase family protein [Aureimonas sp. OT7]
MTLSQFQHYRRIVLAVLIMLISAGLLFVGSKGSEARHDNIEAVGLGLIVIGILGRLWCTLYIGNRKSAVLVDVGPYSITRNPLYLFSSVAAGGVGAQTGSIILSLLFFIGSVVAFQLVIRREERFLSSAFGAPYETYLQRVPRFWPSIQGWRDEPVLTISTGRLYTTFQDGLVFFAAKPAFEFVEYLQRSDVLPVLLRLP